MLRDIKSVIFDLDGTLVDSMWMWKDIDIEYLGRHGIEVPKELDKEIEGKSYTETAVYFKERFALTAPLEEIKKEWVRMAYDKYQYEVPLKKGTIEFLKYLKESGIHTGIATSNSVDLVQAVLRSHGVEEYFDSIHTACEVPAGKPAPDIYLLVAKELKTEPSHCLVFEDVPNGIRAGKNAGMRVCAVEDAYSRADLSEKKMLADYYIDSFDEILEGTYEVLKNEA